jgi:acetyltransferase-like isoleucine patch superfamily enzyme
MEHDYCDISTSTYLNDKGTHDLVIIEDDVWIGAGVYIKSGIRIGRGAVIGAGSIVTKDVSDFSVCMGVPAKHFKPRFGLEKQLKHRQINFNLNPKGIKYESFDS